MSSSTTDHNNGSSAKRSALEILKNYNGPAVRIMEVCGTHTHEIFRLGIRRILPSALSAILFVCPEPGRAFRKRAEPAPECR